MREITPQLSTLKRHFRDAVPGRMPSLSAHNNDLMRIVAELSCLNRATSSSSAAGEDFRNKAGASTLYPSLYRKTSFPGPGSRTSSPS